MNSFFQPFLITNKRQNPFVQSLPSVPLRSLSWGKDWEHTSNVTNTRFPYLSEKQVGNLGKPTIFVSCGCSWGLRRLLGTEEDWAPAAPVLSKHTLVEVSKFRPLGRWGWNNWSDPDLGLVREATKQMRNGYEAEIRVTLDSAAASLLLLHALVLSVLASTCWCN